MRNVVSTCWYHYDSMVPPQSAHAADYYPAFQGQLEVARQAANALGITQPRGLPTAQQRDGHSCGDHVLAGIEALSRRLVTPQPGDSWDLSNIQPSREHVVDTLTRYEQFDALAQAGQGPQPPRHMEAGPRKKRR